MAEPDDLLENDRRLAPTQPVHDVDLGFRLTGACDAPRLSESAPVSLPTLAA